MKRKEYSAARKTITAPMRKIRAGFKVPALTSVTPANQGPKSASK
jgi:hypothetical protein